MFNLTTRKKRISFPISMFHTRTPQYDIGGMMYDFTADPLYPNEISVKENEMVYIVKDDLSPWTRIQKIKTKETGIVPRHYIKFMKPIALVKRKPVAEVLYDFTAVDFDEISVKQGTKLYVLDNDHADWTYVQVVSSTKDIAGYVPRQYIKILRPPLSQRF